jgi:hypothetical protein
VSPGAARESQFDVGADVEVELQQSTTPQLQLKAQLQTQLQHQLPHQLQFYFNLKSTGVALC